MQKSLDNKKFNELEDAADGPDSQDPESKRDHEVVKHPDTTEESTTVVDEEAEDVEDMKPDLGLLVIGGTDDDLKPLRTVDLITESGVCRSHSLPALPEGRHGGVAGLLDGEKTVMVCGGFDMESQVTGHCWQLSWSNNLWTTAPSLIHPTALAAQVSS